MDWICDGRFGKELRVPEDELEPENFVEWQAHPALDTVECIDLHGKDLQDDFVCMLGAVTMRCSRLRILNLSWNQINDDDMRTFAASMEVLFEGGSNLRHLDLSHNLLGPIGAGLIASVYFNRDGAAAPESSCSLSKRRADGQLQSSGFLLDLSYNQLEDAGLEAIALSLGSGTSGRRSASGPKENRATSVMLHVRGIGCTIKGLKEFLKSKECLQELSVSDNKLDVEGVIALCRGIRQCPHWHTLDLSFLHGLHPEAITPDVGATLTKALSSLNAAMGLRDLSCCGIGLGDSWGAELLNSFATEAHAALQRLSLADNDLGFQSAEQLGILLQPEGGMKGLKYLDLDGNAFDDECLQVIAQGLQRSLTLSSLRLARNSISDAGAQALAETLQLQRCIRNIDGRFQLRGLVELDLSCNPIGDDGAEALAYAAMASAQDPSAVHFYARWGLERLSLEDTAVGERGRGTLYSAVATRCALLDQAAENLAKGKLDLHFLRAQRVQMPSCLDVWGIGLEQFEDLRDVIWPMRQSAEQRLREHWPEPDESRQSAPISAATSMACTTTPADEAAGRAISHPPQAASKSFSAATPAVSSLPPDATGQKRVIHGQQGVEICGQASPGPTMVHLDFAESHETKVEEAPDLKNTYQSPFQSFVTWITTSTMDIGGAALGGVNEDDESAVVEEPDGIDEFYAEDDGKQPHTLHGVSTLPEVAMTRRMSSGLYSMGTASTDTLHARSMSGRHLTAESGDLALDGQANSVSSMAHICSANEEAPSVDEAQEEPLVQQQDQQQTQSFKSFVDWIKTANFDDEHIDATEHEVPVIEEAPAVAAVHLEPCSVEDIAVVNDGPCAASVEDTSLAGDVLPEEAHLSELHGHTSVAQSEAPDSTSCPAVEGQREEEEEPKSVLPDQEPAAEPGRLEVEEAAPSSLPAASAAAPTPPVEETDAATPAAPAVPPAMPPRPDVDDESLISMDGRKSASSPASVVHLDSADRRSLVATPVSTRVVDVIEVVKEAPRLYHNPFQRFGNQTSAATFNIGRDDDDEMDEDGDDTHSFFGEPDGLDDFYAADDDDFKLQGADDGSCSLPCSLSLPVAPAAQQVSQAGGRPSSAGLKGMPQRNSMPLSGPLARPTRIWNLLPMDDDDEEEEEEEDAKAQSTCCSTGLPAASAEDDKCDVDSGTGLACSGVDDDEQQIAVVKAEEPLPVPEVCNPVADAQEVPDAEGRQP